MKVKFNIYYFILWLAIDFIKYMTPAPLTLASFNFSSSFNDSFNLYAIDVNSNSSSMAFGGSISLKD